MIGVLKPRAQGIFKFEPQIVTAAIKAVPNQPVVAFGQAVAYPLFSHKSYIVVPRLTTSDDMNRLTSLCSLHGVGLVTFTLNKEQPDYSVRAVQRSLLSPICNSFQVFDATGVADDSAGRRSLNLCEATESMGCRLEVLGAVSGAARHNP